MHRLISCTKHANHDGNHGRVNVKLDAFHEVVLGLNTCHRGIVEFTVHAAPKNLFMLALGLVVLGIKRRSKICYPVV